LTSALDGGEWSASRPGRFSPQGKSPWYPLDRRLGGPQNNIVIIIIIIIIIIMIMVILIRIIIK
jgi:hypothetical protein